ncbi:diacylglycerol/lipid kinase family protein [Ilumatobacter coccineus]|jgi:diacylglycerol kinase (ATP)|uniref:Putative kinase n=1 Tax=Ilumatobacter coccineus (strain NBRC 103263 / KCTC 29153 / YM16-304) TaxID=1313172 RepID=A0A6C7E6M5_ILUCY|nr:diacylglycerol kinase family protein [Ilumatobacter coccineus]BAN03364.1 putative kinase [Ilumatobacter coccineus YM16-304]
MADGFSDRIVVIAHRDESTTAEVVGALHDGGLSSVIDVVRSDDAAGVTSIARDAASQGARAVVAIGGDGTVNLVAQGLMGSSTPLAVAPAGTVNLLSQLTGLDSFAFTVEALKAGDVRSIDVGDVTTDADNGGSTSSPFLLNASSGFDAAVIEDADDHSHARFGRLRFATAGLKRLRRSQPRQLSVHVDGELWFTGRAMSAIVMNFGQRVTADLDVAPDAEPDDGLLDVLVVSCSTLRRFLTVVIRLIAGRAVDPADVLRTRGAAVDVEWVRAEAVQLDGDVSAHTRILRHRVRPSALEVYHRPPRG